MKSNPNLTEQFPNTYELVALEYYDPHKHPTCANFREASAGILRDWLAQLFPNGPGRACEVGAGRSILAELLDRQRVPLDDLLITDSSPSMLSYSSGWRQRGSRLSLNQAEAI